MLDATKRVKDMTGEIFGSLTVIGLHSINPIGNYAMWHCRCTCGKDKVISRGSLKSGNSNSCGRCNDPQTVMLKNLFSTAKYSAKSRSKEFTLTLEQHTALSLSDCAYCGLPPSNIATIQRASGETIQYSGIDRVDNLIGYIFENCVSCCSKCNYAKMELSKDEFFSWLKALYEHSVNN